MPKLSIIVPVYKVEPYLRKCLDSIRAQTMADFECILIDDGSPDGCGAICDEYAALDGRFVVLHQANTGVSAARNAGLDIAKGEYIGFVDPDDFIEPEMYAAMLQTAEETGAQLVCCQWDNVFEDGRQEQHNGGEPLQGTMSGTEFLRHMFDIPRSVGGACWNKLFQKDYAHNSFDTGLTICEDNLFLTHCCMGISTAAALPQVFYHLLNRSDSATRQDCNHVAGEIIGRKKVALAVLDWDRQAGDLAESEFCNACVRALLSQDPAMKPETRALARSELRQYIKAHWRHYWRSRALKMTTKLYFCYLMLRA